MGEVDSFHVQYSYPSCLIFSYVGPLAKMIAFTNSRNGKNKESDEI